MVLLVRFTLSAFPEWPVQNDGCCFWVATAALQDLRLAGLPALRVLFYRLLLTLDLGVIPATCATFLAFFTPRNHGSVVLVLSSTGRALCDLRTGNDFFLDSFSTTKRQ